MNIFISEMAPATAPQTNSTLETTVSISFAFLYMKI
jgi:hypothetical protein